MKKTPIILTIILIATGILAQVPEKISYQAVIRNADNNLVTNQSVGMQISILQGSANGTAVYVETQSLATNANGLVSIKIGGGTVVSGNFTTIDWANGPYFIKTEIDPSGGTDYTISGTSQLLSVPYALHAKTAETVTGTITESDPVYSGSNAANITSTDITNLSNLSGTNTGDQNLGHLATKTALEDSIEQLRSEITYSVGDFAQGGVVFWVDGTGQHGLVCAKSDQSTGVRWYAGTSGNTQAKGDGPYAGEANTAIIIAATVAIGDDGSTYAARICNELQIAEEGIIYGDWYLPSKYELNLMFQYKFTINITAIAHGGSGLAGANYWSSTESGINYVWRQNFNIGSQGSGDKSHSYRVRAVRAF